MTDKRQPSPVDERDFDAIEAAVMETERGRWFLGEFARRNRIGETRLLLEAISRLEQNAGGAPPDDETEIVRAEIGRLADQLSRGLAGLGGGGTDGNAALQTFIHSIERVESATSDIHDAAERVSEIAWQLREAGAGGRICSELERAAADISTASAFGGLTVGRAKALATAVSAVLQGLATLPPSWRPAALAGPSLPDPVEDASDPVSGAEPTGKGSAEPAVTELLEASSSGNPTDPPESAPGIEPRPRHPEPSSIRMPIASLAAIDELDFRERLKLFT